MSDGTKVIAEGGGGKRGGALRNNVRNKNQPKNNLYSQPSKLKYLETTTYTVSQFYLAD